jgi:uncharacterized protein YndB with AHSA1/START domain
VARTEHSVEIPRPPEEVFPWLFEEDKVPRWTSGLEGYERLDSGPLGRGSRFRQRLEVSGQRFHVEMEITEYDPPRAATSRFEVRGIDVVSTYTLSGATTLTQSIDASGGGLTGRLLIPMLQPHLERKLETDLARLRDLLSQG